MSSRTRNWATIVYPESAPENWENILEDFKIACYISPLHDSDFNADGEIKKAHYHIIIKFDGVKTEEQAQDVFTAIGGVGCKEVRAIRGYARYLCHLDNPEKAQYSVDGVRSLCGADYLEEISLISDRYFALRQIVAFCKAENIFSYSKLVNFCLANKEDWFRIVCDNTFFLTGYLKSMRLDREEESNSLPKDLEDLKKKEDFKRVDIDSLESL